MSENLLERVLITAKNIEVNITKKEKVKLDTLLKRNPLYNKRFNSIQHLINFTNKNQKLENILNIQGREIGRGELYILSTTNAIKIPKAASNGDFCLHGKNYEVKDTTTNSEFRFSMIQPINELILRLGYFNEKFLFGNLSKHPLKEKWNAMEVAKNLKEISEKKIHKIFDILIELRANPRDSEVKRIFNEDWFFKKYTNFEIFSRDIVNYVLNKYSGGFILIKDGTYKLFNTGNSEKLIFSRITSTGFKLKVKKEL